MWEASEAAVPGFLTPGKMGDRSSAENETKSSLTQVRSSGHHVTLSKRDVDTAAELVAGRTDVKLDPETAARLRYVFRSRALREVVRPVSDVDDYPYSRKIDWHIMPLFCCAYASICHWAGS